MTQMQEYQSQPVQAVRWMKEDDYPMARIIHPQLIYSFSGNHFYLSHKEVPSDSWLPVNPKAEDTAGQMLPFAFWSVKSGRRVNIDWDNVASLSDEDRLNFRRAINLAYDKKPEMLGYALLPYGVLEIPRKDGGSDSKIVNRGDWIVKDALGNIMVRTNEEFLQLHAPMM